MTEIPMWEVAVRALLVVVVWEFAKWLFGLNSLMDLKETKPTR
jgi:hypothetical protein